MKQKWINIGKNFLLVFLSLLMAFLTVSIWIRSLSWEDIPVESGFGQLYLRMAYGSASVFGLRTEDVPAAYPTEIAVQTNGTMCGAQNDISSVDALLEQFREPIGSALSESVRNLHAGDTDSYFSALRQDCVFFRYEHALPLDLIFLWMGNNVSGIPAVSAKSILISAANEVWIRDEKNTLFVYSTDTDAKGWSDRIGDSIFQPCSFILEEAEHNGLIPETLVFDHESPCYPVFKVSKPQYLDGNGVDNLQIVLEAFEYNTSVGNYMDHESRVFVNNNSTLRIGEQGEILFRATSLDGGMEAYQESEITGNNELPLRVNAAKTILEQIQRSYISEADFYLQSVVQDANSERVQLYFRYLCNGISVVGEEGNFAVIEFLGNTLVSAEIHTHIFTATDEMRYLIPSDQMIAMADLADTNIFMGYFSDDEYVYPNRYFERVV